VETIIIWVVVMALVITSVSVYAARFRRQRALDSQRLHQTRELGMDKAAGQYPLVDAGVCIGCGTCVAACPEGDVLGVVMGKAVVINGARCIGHGKCAEACPVGAIKVGLGDITKRDDIPLLDEHNQTNVPGIWIAGELSGFELINNAVEQGRRVMERIAATGGPKSAASGGNSGGGDSSGGVLNGGDPSGGVLLDALVVGAGPAGMSAGLVASEHGLSCLILDQQGAGGTILQYPRRKLVMVQPVEIPRLGRLPRHEYSKEELLEIWEKLHSDFDLDIRTGVRVTGVVDGTGNFLVQTSAGEFRCRNIILALGRRGTPRRLNVPGEDLAKVAYKLIDAEAYQGRRVLVVGGGDSAVEAAMGLAHQEGCQVTMSYRKAELMRIKQRNADRIAPLIADGTLKFLGATTVTSIHEDMVTLEGPDGPIIVPNDDVFILAGGIPPFGFLRELGVKFGGDQQDITAAVV
jgi:thioredoxin reductase (NADPH)